MHSELNLLLILGIALIAVASPGPATLAVSATSMSQSRKHGLMLASGISTGSLVWNVGAALGLGAIMAANAVFVEIFRYLGSGYLLYLGYKSLRSAIKPSKTTNVEVKKSSYKTTFLKGFALHITNPKAILFFSSLYAIGVPTDASAFDLTLVVAGIALQTAFVMHFYAIFFSFPKVVTIYNKLKRGFDATFAAVFGIAGIKILMSDAI